MNKGKIKRRMALILSAVIMLSVIAVIIITGKRRGSEKDPMADGTERVMNPVTEKGTKEALNVAVADDGTLIDSSTGKTLTSEEIDKLVEEGVVEITEDGKPVITASVGDGVSTLVIDETSEDTTERTSGSTISTTGEESTTRTTTEGKTESTTRTSTTEGTTRATTTEATTKATTRETTTESTTRTTTRETTTESTTRTTTRETTTEATTKTTTRETTTEGTTAKVTEKPTEAPTEAHKHTWVWEVHIETIHHDAETHQEPVYDYDWSDPNLKDVKFNGEWITGYPQYETKIHCGACGTFYDSYDDFYANDTCAGASFGEQPVLVDVIPAEKVIVDYNTVVDKAAWDEEIEVKDYQYCSKCGVRK